MFIGRVSDSDNFILPNPRFSCQVREMPTLSVVIPHYSETIRYSKKDLFSDGETKVSNDSWIFMEIHWVSDRLMIKAWIREDFFIFRITRLFRASPCFTFANPRIYWGFSSSTTDPRHFFLQILSDVVFVP